MIISDRIYRMNWKNWVAQTNPVPVGFEQELFARAMQIKVILFGEFWDTHELSGFWNKTKEASFEVDIGSEVIYYAIDKMLSEKI